MQKTMRNCGPLPYKQKQIGATLKTLPASERMAFPTSSPFTIHLHPIIMIAPMATPALSGMVAAVSAHSPNARLAHCALSPALLTFSCQVRTTSSQNKPLALCNARAGRLGCCGERGLAGWGLCLRAKSMQHNWSRPSDSDFSADLAWACCAARHDLPLRRSPPPERR